MDSIGGSMMKMALRQMRMFQMSYRYSDIILFCSLVSVCLQAIFLMHARLGWLGSTVGNSI